MVERAADRLRAWAADERAAAPLADPLDRPVILENSLCLNALQTILRRPDRDHRALGRPLAVPPRLLPPA
ncbi:MAG TPA: hypothetical protein P5330_02700 [Candidatus Competibacteraceae bacterium]|nr:hypothetical protein [Candidatus Competibacteraceae bacterium]